MDAVEDLSSILSIQTNNTSTKILNIIRWVITAWHCVWADVLEGIMPVWKVAVVVGAHNKSSCVKYDRENTKYIISTALAHVSN